MGSELPALEARVFERRLRACSPEPLTPEAVAALYRHYQELRRWNRRFSLVGPGTAGQVVERHYGEALAVLTLLPEGPGVLVDVGSGAGFPGLVLAAVRPRLDVVLVEPRQRKWAFLQAAAERAALPCRCLDARVESSLPEGFPDRIDWVTLRALRLSPEGGLEALASRLTSGGAIFAWCGRRLPALPPGLAVSGEVSIAGSEARRVVRLERVGVRETEGRREPSAPGSG